MSTQRGTVTSQEAKDRSHFATPMYEGLETNIPHILMEHSDDKSLRTRQLFPSREAVLEYLRHYGRDVRHHVRFHTLVEDIQLQNSAALDQWSIRSRDLLSNERSIKEYDAVVIASGHYSVPFIPDIMGIRDWADANPDIISHSKYYRSAESFDGKKTVVVGYSASGVDITHQLSSKAKWPIMVSQRSPSAFTFPKSYKVDVPEIVEFLPSSRGRKAVRFANGHIEEDLDAILFCTGYLFSYPYLSSLKPPIISNGERVQHLYKQIFHIKHPSLAFIGLPSKIIPFRTFECQAAVIAKVLAQRLVLPTAEAMQDWETRMIEERGEGKKYSVLDHPKDFDYHNELVAWATQTREPSRGIIPPIWTDEDYWVRKNIPAIKASFSQKGEGRHAFRRIEDLGLRLDNNR